MKALAALVLLLSMAVQAGQSYSCYQVCPEGQLCDPIGFSFALDEGKVTNVEGFDAKVLRVRQHGNKLKVKTQDQQMTRTFRVDLRKLGQDVSAGHTSYLLGLLKFPVQCSQH